MLQRAYYRGVPYVIDPLDDRADNGRLWQSKLSPSEIQPSEYPNYIDNIHRGVIDQMVSDILPAGSRLVFNGVTDEDKRKAIEKALLNFGPMFTSGKSGFFEWAEVLLADAAVSRDGLLVPRYLEAEGQVRLNYYAGEDWDLQFDPDADDVEFYRVEYQFVARDGKTYWRRIDFRRNEILRYVDKDIAAAWSPTDIYGDMKAVYGDMNFAQWIAGPMTVRAPGSILEAAGEASLLSELGWLPTAIRWRRSAFNDHRGEAEFSSAELSAIDDVNRLLTRWKEAAIGVGDPALAAIDLMLPSEAGEQGEELTLSDVKPGDFLDVKSVDDKDGRLMYPDNLPTQFPHGAALDYLRQAVLGDTPSLGLDPTKISRFGELSGFAAKTLRGSYDRRIHKHRTRLLDNGILTALNKGLAILAKRDKLPDGVETKNLEVGIEFAAPEYSPDEMVKLMTAVQMMRMMRAPVKDQLAVLPYKPFDAGQTEAALQKSMDEMDLVAQMQTAAGAGIDNKAKAGNAGARGSNPSANGSAAGSSRRSTASTTSPSR